MLKYGALICVIYAFLKGVPSTSSVINNDDLNIKLILNEFKKDIKKYGVRAVKDKVKVKIDKLDLEGVPGLDIRIPNPFNLINVLRPFVFSETSVDHNDQPDRDRLVSELLKECLYNPSDTQKSFDIQPSLQDVLDEYSKEK